MQYKLVQYERGSNKWQNNAPNQDIKEDKRQTTILMLMISNEIASQALRTVLSLSDYLAFFVVIFARNEVLVFNH